MDVDGLLPLTLLIYDGFLCCCDELWPSLIAIFFVVKKEKYSPYGNGLDVSYLILESQID